MLAFGVGLDPRQSVVFGPKLGPFLVACALGLTSFSSVGLAPGYPGAGLNPARCFSAAVARGTFQRKVLPISHPALARKCCADNMRQINGYTGLVRLQDACFIALRITLCLHGTEKGHWNE